MSNLNKISDTLMKYYDYHSGCITLPLRVVNENSEIRNTIFELLKLGSENNKEYNWALEYCVIFDDKENKNVDGICLRQVESF